MLRFVIFFCLFTVYSATTTTHRTRPTHEPSEHETFVFNYEPYTHKFVISIVPDCYIFSLTDDERIAVHTDAGIKSLELKLAGMIGTADKTVVTRENINGHVLHACARKTTNYYVMSM